MSKKLTRHGDGLALVIEKPLLQILNITEKTNLEILVKNGSLLIRPIEKKERRSKNEIKEIAQEIIDEYADVFEKLAK